jgi:ankyrin repeat protein
MKLKSLYISIILLISAQSIYGMELQRTILDAIRAGDIEEVQQLLQTGADINARDNGGCTSLHYALRAGQLEMVKLLVANGANLNARADNGWTPLHHAVSAGQLKMVKLLVANGANLNARDNGGWTPLHDAVSEGKLEVVKLLVDSGADVNARDNIGCAAIHHALRAGQLEIAKCLVDGGADINARDNSDWTSLYHAVSKRKLETAKWLVENGSDINAQNNWGMAAIHYAAEHGHLKLVKWLLDHGADVNTQNYEGRMALHYAIHNGHLGIAKLLVANGANINTSSNNVKVSIDFAVLETFQWLLDKGVDLNVNKIAVTEVVAAKKLEVSRLLMGNGIRIPNILVITNDEIKSLLADYQALAQEIETKSVSYFTMFSNTVSSILGLNNQDRAQTQETIRQNNARFRRAITHGYFTLVKAMLKRYPVYPDKQDIALAKDAWKKTGNPIYKKIGKILVDYYGPCRSLVKQVILQKSLIDLPEEIIEHIYEQ